MTVGLWAVESKG